MRDCLWRKRQLKYGGVNMIVLKKLNGEEFTLNCDLIETVYENPDTTIHLTNGHIYIVSESMEEVIKKSINYRREIYFNNQKSRF